MSMYFISSVHTYKVGTAKARVIQAATAPFEHAMLGEAELNALAGNIRLITDICNLSYRGNTLSVSHADGQISVRYPANGSEQVVVSISYVKVLRNISHRCQIREAIQERIEGKFSEVFARYIVEYSQKGGAL